MQVSSRHGLLPLVISPPPLLTCLTQYLHWLLFSHLLISVPMAGSRCASLCCKVVQLFHNMQRVITPNNLSSASCFTWRFSTTQKAAYILYVLNRAFRQRQKENMEQGQVVLCLFIVLFYFIYFIHSFIFSILIKFYHVLIFAFLSE